MISLPRTGVTAECYNSYLVNYNSRWMYFEQREDTKSVEVDNLNKEV